MTVGEFSTSFSNHFSLGTLLSASINSSLAPSTSWSLHRKNVTRAKAEVSWIIIVRAASIILLMMDTLQASSWEMGKGSYVDVHVSVHVYVWLQLVFSPVCVCVWGVCCTWGRCHGCGHQPVDIECSHLLHLRCSNGCHGVQVGSLCCCHQSCLLLHHLLQGSRGVGRRQTGGRMEGWTEEERRLK